MSLSMFGLSLPIEMPWPLRNWYLLHVSIDLRQGWPDYPATSVCHLGIASWNVQLLGWTRGWGGHPRTSVAMRCKGREQKRWTSTQHFEGASIGDPWLCLEPVHHRNWPALLCTWLSFPGGFQQRSRTIRIRQVGDHHPKETSHEGSETTNHDCWQTRHR